MKCFARDFTSDMTFQFLTHAHTVKHRTHAAYRRGVKNQLALIQLATRDTVYMIPVHETTDRPQETFGAENLSKLTDVLNDVNILKVGFALTDDIELIRNNVLKDIKLSMAGWLDLQLLWGKGTNFDKSFKDVFLEIKFHTTNGRELDDRGLTPSLCHLVYVFLGKPLSKNTESKWLLRPLSKEQEIVLNRS